MHGEIFPPTHRGPRYIDVPFIDICYLSPTSPIIATLNAPKTLCSASGSIVPQNSRQARALTASAKWLAVEDDEMKSVIEKKSDQP